MLDEAGALGFGAMRLSTENVEESAALRLMSPERREALRRFSEGSLP